MTAWGRLSVFSCSSELLTCYKHILQLQLETEWGARRQNYYHALLNNAILHIEEN